MLPLMATIFVRQDRDPQVAKHQETHQRKEYLTVDLLYQLLRVPDISKSMKVHLKPLLETSVGADDRPIEQENKVDIQDETSQYASSSSNDVESVNTVENHAQDKAMLDQKMEEMETRVKKLERELREVAALEISLYSVVPEHSSSAHKVQTPARRLLRLYIFACKYWSQDMRATVARNTVSGLVLVAKSCGNDVSRLTFWLSNTVVLREIISIAFGSSRRSNALAKMFESNGQEKKSEAKVHLQKLVVLGVNNETSKES